MTKNHHKTNMRPITKSEIIAIESKLLEAIKNCNIAVLNELLHDDLLFVIPTGQTITKVMDLENLKSGNLKIDNISASSQDISIVEDNAIVSVEVHLKGSYLNQPIDDTFKYLRIWKLLDGALKVIGGAGIQI